MSEARDTTGADWPDLARAAVSAFLRGRRVAHHEYDDLFAAALAGVWRASRKYDEARGEWKKYAIYCSIRAITDYLRGPEGVWTRAGRVRTREKTNQFVGVSGPRPSYAPPDPAAPPFRPEEDGRIPRELLRSLPARDARVLLLRFEDGLFQKEIADFLGYSETRIGQIVRGAVGEIRQRMGVDW